MSMLPVFYCGPAALAKELKEKAKRANSKSVRFTFRKEHFVSAHPCFVTYEATR